VGNKDRRELDPRIEDEGEAEKVYAELKKLDEEIKELEAGPFAPNSDFMQSLPEREREELLEELRKGEEAEKAGAADQGGAEEYQTPGDTVTKPTPKVIEKVTLQVPQQYQVLVNKFNKSLQQASNDEKPPTAAYDLWVWYNRCKNTVPYFLYSVPRSAWDTLWDVQNDTISAT